MNSQHKILYRLSLLDRSGKQCSFRLSCLIRICSSNPEMFTIMCHIILQHEFDCYVVSDLYYYSETYIKGSKKPKKSYIVF